MISNSGSVMCVARVIGFWRQSPASSAGAGPDPISTSTSVASGRDASHQLASSSSSGYTAAYERSIRLLEPILKIEDRIKRGPYQDTTATTAAGLLVQVGPLEAALPSSCHGDDRLLACIIAGLEGMTEAVGDG
jgi:hypothetical protein